MKGHIHRRGISASFILRHEYQWPGDNGSPVRPSNTANVKLCGSCHGSGMAGGEPLFAVVRGL